MPNLQAQTLSQTPFLEKLLGGNYKWWYVMVYNFRSASAYIWSDLYYYLNQILTTYISIIIWQYSNRNDTADTLNYLLFGNIILSITLLNNHWRMSSEVFEGKISSKLLLPISLTMYYFFNAAAYSFKVSLVILFYIPLFIYFKDYLVLNLYTFLILLVYLPIVYIAKFMYNQLVASTVFYLTNNEGFLSFSETILVILSGSLIPLSIININFLYFTPFAFLLHHPMQIYLGKYTQLQTLYVFLGGLAWCLVLYLLAKLIFKLGLKRYESVGL